MRSFSVLLAVALLVAVALAAEDVPSLNEKEKEAVDKSHLASVTGEDVEALSQVECDRMNGSCTGCLSLPHCRYLIHHKACIEESDVVKHKKAKIAASALSCPASTDAPALANPAFRAEDTNTTTTIATTPSTTSAATNETTTSATPTTTLTPDNSTTTVQTTTTANPNTTTPTTESSSSTTSTTTAPNSTIPTTVQSTTHPVTTPAPTPVPTPTPDPSGRKFDGWSFFGGILVTLTLAAIGYMSFRYYKSRSGTGGGTNYNRF